MMVDDLHRLIEKGEGEHAEFRPGATPSETVARIICAFLNKGGGQLLLGVGDKGQIVGVPDAETELRTLKAELPNLISPPALWNVEHVRLADQDLMLIDVPEGQDKPYLVEGAIYLRRGGRVVAANRDEIGQLIHRRAEVGQRWERQLSMGAEREDLDEQLVLQTLRFAVDSQRWQGGTDDSTGFLNSLGLIEQGGVTNAALLLYGKTPSRTLPQARVRLLVMPEGKTGNRYVVDRLFERCLLQTAMELPQALGVHVGGVESRFSKGWQRSDRPMYPMTALREGIMNALVHRDYTLSGSTVVSVLQDELQISNPGGLPNELKPSDLKKQHPSLPRNPDVAHVCFLHGLIEKVGRGTQRIVEDCREAKLPGPKWQSSSFETTLTLYSPVARGQRAEHELNDRQQQILAAL